MSDTQETVAEPVVSSEKPEAFLKWEPFDDGSGWFADNTADILYDDEYPASTATFQISPTPHGFVVAKDPFLTRPWPDAGKNGVNPYLETFDTLDAAKAWCEKRNAELLASAGKSNPEAVKENLTTEGKPAAPAPSEDYDLRKYLESSPAERLMILASAWRKTSSDHSRTFYEGQMMGLTIDMDCHPDGFDHGCLCAECRSCE